MLVFLQLTNSQVRYSNALASDGIIGSDHHEEGFRTKLETLMHFEGLFISTSTNGHLVDNIRCPISFAQSEAHVPFIDQLLTQL